MTANDRYNSALNSIPAPGGNGCHPALLGVANLGAIAGIEPARIFSDIRNAIPPGRRHASDKEIQVTVSKAVREHSGKSFTPEPRPAPIVADGKATLRKIIDQAIIDNEVDLWEASPVRLYDDPKQDAALLLRTLYRPDDLLFIGDRAEPGILGQTIRPAADWITYFQTGGATAPHIIINPLTGKLAPVKGSDKMTLRGDACIKDFRFCLVEFDNLSFSDQIKFWSAVKLPICALIHSGGKSIHAWLQVSKLADVTTHDQWDSIIRDRLYARVLKPLGVDGACSNPARLSRLPGHYRTEKKQMQKILWLSPEGRPIS